MGVHEREESANVGKLLPDVTRHFVEQGLLSVDHFVMRNGQYEILSEGIEQAERDLFLLILADDGIGFKIRKHVVHSSNVPLHCEADPSDKNKAYTTRTLTTCHLRS